MESLEELEKKYKELGEEIERLKNKKNKRGRNERGRVTESSTYYFITDSGDIGATLEQYDNLDNFRYSIRNYFLSSKETKKHLDRLKTYYQLKNLAEELNTEEVDWKNLNQAKYSIFLDNSKPEKLRQTSLFYSQSIGDICCTNKNFLDIAKQKIGEENLINLFKEDI